jgi:hypothetical protein
LRGWDRGVGFILLRRLTNEYKQANQYKQATEMRRSCMPQWFQLPALQP